GLTDAGFALVRECNRLGVLIDLAHTTEKGFWDVAKTTDQPLVASHSNDHALTPVARNLTDRQLDAIRESRGLVGINYATAM
ncbi:membrane dipeptidase, partial [Rhizobium ruizarguesonis]